MTLPLVGITTGHSHNAEGDPAVSVMEAYVQAVLKAGGAPLLLPVGLGEAQLQAVFPHLQGLLLTGGSDIDPARFHGQPHPSVYGVDSARDAMEFSLTRDAVESGLPFLGICRGFQVVNVALGGSLYTDLPDQYPEALRHDNLPGEPRDRLAHPVQLEPGSCLAQIAGLPVLEVNSLHHQGARQIAPGLTVSARAPDGLVEGLELPGHPFGVAVQWHPEWLPASPPMQALFLAFISAAEEVSHSGRY